MGDSNSNGFVTWLAANIENVRNGAGSFEGVRVTADSLTVRYFTCLSFLVFTTRSTSPFLLQGTDAERSTAVKSTMLTLLLGWWGIPFGLIFTPVYLLKNFLGGDKCTVAELINMLENPKEFEKRRDSFRYAPLAIMLAAFGCIACLMLAMQGYLWTTRGTSAGHRPVHSRSSAYQRAPGAPATESLTYDPVANYMGNLQHRLKEAWSPPRGNASASVVVTFEIDKYGKASKLKVSKSSGKPAMDQAALNAVKAAQPYPPLPEVLHGVAPIEFTFDYNVLDQKRGKVPVEADSEDTEQ